MRILITGATGMLGSDLVEHLRNKGEMVERFDRENISWEHQASNIEILSGFDCIVHAAANTDVEACELDPASCYRDNALLTERLAAAASRANCKLIYISSTGIYGTGKTVGAYSEYDEVCPTTHHHRAKWLGEQAVNRHVSNALILRTGWIFGGDPSNPKNFVSRRIEEALTHIGNPIRSNYQQNGVPTYVKEISSKLYELLKSDEVGTFNVVSQGHASRYEYVSKILEFAKIDVRVVPARNEFFERKAKVSMNETAVNLRLRQLGYSDLPFWEESLRHYIQFELTDWLAEKSR